jgi:transposase
MTRPIVQIPEIVYERASRKDLIALLKAETIARSMMQAELDRLKKLKEDLEEKVVMIEGQLVRVTSKLFGKSSEKSPPNPNRKNPEKAPPTKKEKTKRLPSERYPNAPVIERELRLEEAPACSCCGHKMIDSGLTETTEYLDVIPKQYRVIRQIRHKYNCGKCHGDIKTAPALPRIKPGSAYSDEMTIDAGMSKYCDLIPMERYCEMAKRQGFAGLPPHSLIEATHHLADFVTGAVDKVKEEVKALEVMRADETPHRMLEGDPRSHWYLWGFSGDNACYFECHDTRSGDVATAILKEARCRVLLTDVYAGYGKAIREANIERAKKELPLISDAFCNAHSRRKINDVNTFEAEKQYYLAKYREIYALEAQAKGKPPPAILECRSQMRPIFEEMRQRADQDLQTVSDKSSLAVALKYFLGNYGGLTMFLSNPAIPIDNNAQERSLRSHVVGRKTWYGTHSRRGAETAAKLFSLVESCKLCHVNPREYFAELVKALHLGKSPFTPSEFKRLKLN